MTERNWADDDDELDETVPDLPPPQTITNKDGTKTTTSYYVNDEGQKVKSTRRIRLTVVKEHVHPRVAERKTWAKFGASAQDPAGPGDTTTRAESITFRPSVNWRRDEKAARSAPTVGVIGTPGSDPSAAPADNADGTSGRDRQVKCRICSGSHFTTRCMFRNTMAPLGEDGSAAVDVAAGMGDDPSSGAVGGGGGLGSKPRSSYVPPALRPGGAAGDRPPGGAGGLGGGKYSERDDAATLRVTNVSELAEEQELRDMFERFGRVIRVFLAKDRETQLAKGFAFISFADRADAARACAKMDGYGFKHLILKVEFSKKT